MGPMTCLFCSTMTALGSEWTQCANIVCSGPYTAPYRRLTSDRIIRTRLLGPHQADNAATAWAAVNALVDHCGWQLSLDAAA